MRDLTQRRKGRKVEQGKEEKVRFRAVDAEELQTQKGNGGYKAADAKGLRALKKSAVISDQ